MLAIVVREFGPPDVLEPADAPEPEAGAGGAIVEVELASVTFVETQLRAGRPPVPAMAPQLPWIPGNGVGGRVGDHRVVATTGGAGGYAQRAAAPSGALIVVPDALSLADAVALLADGRTALGLMESAEVQPGETVLVEAAAGGVGSLLVQLAHNAGARVVAAAGGPRKVELAASLGADVAVDYSEEGWERAAGPVDVVFDGVGGAVARAAFGLVREGGRLSSYGMAGGSFADVGEDEARARGVALVRGARPSPERMRELSQRALAEAAAGRLRPVIGQSFALERAADAHAAIESRATVGKTLLTVRP